MKKWGFVFIVLVLGGIIIASWQEQIKTKYIVNNLESIQSVDLIRVQNSQTDKLLMEYTDKNASFSEMVNIYKYPYYELKGTEKKLVNKDPAFVIEFLQENSVQYKVNVYELNEEDKEIFKTSNYLYSPENVNDTYVFALEKYPHLVGVNEGLIQILNKALIH
ncbi:hypothetical protein M9R32_13470 [Paenisporosarcina quisquiliarum]|uniref:DUF4825 domain-containing protein n=1 Tax=Paenisporosarcina quisquiliarum TaxID=365346 RepID=A0A9X3RDW0_9BACL|nr:hypothetical protein [Paenisporosarcina quisquiliarum]MCZ8538200.1 hypothetical protein [Paenisporosarcina quisquiliarum]